MLEQASIALTEADSARDRVRALTETIQAYEAGLSAMRDGLRMAATARGATERRVAVRGNRMWRSCWVCCRPSKRPRRRC